MEKLNYAVLKNVGYTGYILEHAPEKVLQFGEGNFLRAFVDYWFDLANERAGWNGKCVLVQPVGGGSLAGMINEQEGLYTLHLRGSRNGKKVDEARVISSISRCLNPKEKDDYEAMMAVAESDDLKIIVSNTTEAGIVYDPSCRKEDCPPASFPAKLTQVLLRRFQAGKPGVIMLACELIDNNGKELLNCVNQYIDQWGLDDGFKKYVNEDCTFCGSLVDRIVPGRVRDPKEVAALEELHGYSDPLLDVGEVFGLWVIEGEESLNDVLPFAKAGLQEQVIVTPDMSPYKKRKVRILNGAHTGFAPGAYLAGEDIVRDCMQDETIRRFMNRMLYDEVIPTLPEIRPSRSELSWTDRPAAEQSEGALPQIRPSRSEFSWTDRPAAEQSEGALPLDPEELSAFASAVQDRFNNPFIDHELISISLNSTAKWKTRNLPSFLAYIEKNGKLPVCLTTSLASYIAFYSNDIQELTDRSLICRRPAVGKAVNLEDRTYAVSDDRQVLEFYYEHRTDSEEELVHAVLTNEKMWGQNLAQIAGLEEKTTAVLKKIRTEGAKAAYADCL